VTAKGRNYSLNYGWHGSLASVMSLDRLSLQLIIIAMVVSALRTPPEAGAKVLRVLFTHANYLFGDPICLLLLFIFWSINFQFCLYIAISAAIWIGPNYLSEF